MSRGLSSPFPGEGGGGGGALASSSPLVRDVRMDPDPGEIVGGGRGIKRERGEQQLG